MCFLTFLILSCFLPFFHGLRAEAVTTQMSLGQTLRALVNERLAAVAEEIFMLLERTIAEYKEELRRSKKENQRKQQLLDRLLSPTVELVRENVKTPLSPSLNLNQEITQTPWIKDDEVEQIIKQEQEQLPVPVLKSSAVCMKTEESSLVQQRQTEHREETQGVDINSEQQLNSETEGHSEHSCDTDNHDYCKPFSFSADQMETEADGDHDNQVQTTDRSTKLFPQNKSTPITTVHSGGAERKHECPFCIKRFQTKSDLQKHIRVHTGEKPYSCSFCDKSFTQKVHLRSHKRIHTEEKPYSCSICEKTFIRKISLDTHMRTHTGEKPYSCSVCGKNFADPTAFKRHEKNHSGERPYICSTCGNTFAQKSNLDIHQRIHTGERPYSCSMCNKTFKQKNCLDSHTRTHTSEKPFSCTVCTKTFSKKVVLDTHIRTHTGEKPFSCIICDKSFGKKSNLASHMRTHTGEKPYSCSNCGKTYRELSGLRKHERTHSAETLQVFNLEDNFYQ